MTSHRHQVLIHCSGLDCRALLAEAILNFDLADKVCAFSTGRVPTEHLSEHALLALWVAGIPDVGLRPREMVEYDRYVPDLLLIVEDEVDLADLSFPEAGKRLHLPFPDPQSELLVEYVAQLQALRSWLSAAVLTGLEAD